MTKLFSGRWLAFPSFLLILLICTYSIRADEYLASEDTSEEIPLPPRQMENLGRGVIAVNLGGGLRSRNVYVGWRMLGTDPETIAFNLYRSTGESEPVKLNDEPITQSTNYIDDRASLNQSVSYFVKPIVDGNELAASAAFTLPANSPVQQYLTIDLQTPDGYTPNDASAGDLDGDGEYEIILHQTGASHDNAHDGYTDEPILQAYKLDGTFLWEINLGINIREGAHYTQFMVYDLDGDGRAEVACKTADGSVDGLGNIIGDPNADYRNSSGRILAGPEFLTIFDGLTGAELVTTDYIPPRGKVSNWGDSYGNRVDRFLACIAYLDGERPSLVMCRGYYTRAVLAAWNFRDGELTNIWTFDSDDGTAGNRDYRGQGNHNLSVGDVDNDGRDEIIYGACAIDDDGTGLYSTGLGHGDAMHLSDIDPGRPGLEVFQIHEGDNNPGAELRDALTGEIIWQTANHDSGRGLAADIDAGHLGYECWGGPGGLRNCVGESIGSSPSSTNFACWWDGDLLRELLDSNRIDKHGLGRLLTAAGCSSNNGTKSTPVLCADILGDWREEVIWRTDNNQQLRIYTTTIPTEYRFYTLMHDPVYRLSVAWQNVAYNQPTQPGFYLGADMQPPPQPNIILVENQLISQ
ncbi:MAG: rhamnogalacturonan lyase [Sedimentisphaerales bacterium]|nr:rhamnogalacturonan lyase [Sedimentisphaerales bacterium]